MANIHHLTFLHTAELTTPEGVSHHMEQIKRLVDGMNDAIDALQKQASAQPTLAPTIVQNTTVQNNSEALKFQQSWDLNGIVQSNDVRDVNVLSPLQLIRRGRYGVQLSYNPSGTGSNSTVYIPASNGGWTTCNEPMGIGLTAPSPTKLRVEVRFNYLNSARSTFLRLSANVANIPADLIVEANSNGSSIDTTKWCLKNGAVGSGNVVTFPAPPPNIPVVLVFELDCTNAGSGSAQWLVGVDTGNGLIAQPLTNVTNNHTSSYSQIFRATWGSDYGDPTYGVSATGAFPTNLFDGVIAERRMFTSTTGVLGTPPAYGTMIGDWRPTNLVQATYIDCGMVTLTQGSTGQPLTGSFMTYIATGNGLAGNSVVLLTPTGVADPATSFVKNFIIALTNGFPGTVTLATPAITGAIPTYTIGYTVVTPNVARIKNLAFPDDDRYDLFHIPVANSNPLVYPPLVVNPIHTLKGVATPEQFIGANG